MKIHGLFTALAIIAFTGPARAEGLACINAFSNQTSALQVTSGKSAARKTTGETASRAVTIEIFSKTETQDNIIAASENARGGAAIKDGQIVRLNDGIDIFEFSLPKLLELETLKVQNLMFTGKLIEAGYMVDQKGSHQSINTTAKFDGESLVIERVFSVAKKSIEAKLTFKLEKLADSKVSVAEVKMLNKIFDLKTREQYMEVQLITLTKPIILSAK